MDAYLRAHGYEGRIRPSLIAAAIAAERADTEVIYEGRIRPSLIAACPQF